MKISCDKAKILCHKSQYNEASLWDIIRLKLHLFTCKACNAFSSKNTRFTTLCDQAHLQGLSEQEKLIMKEKLEHSR